MIEFDPTYETAKDENGNDVDIEKLVCDNVLTKELLD